MVRRPALTRAAVAVVLAAVAASAAACGGDGADGGRAANPGASTARDGGGVPTELQKYVDDADRAAQQGEREMADEP
ncbi:hypothetical protein [Actinomadura atramentaria]|uniref:hypothetical protein n=1 Tax=Actinomadura atramentaria TaxID=1990 RepID=UPI0003663E17|nr:hypothetical protein [Actinomadura atramentaria]